MPDKTAKLFAVPEAPDDGSGSACPPTSDPHSHLVSGAQAGDRAALEELLRTVAPRIMGITARILGPHTPEAEDAAQDAMVDFMRALKGFRGDSSVIYYATRIAVRTALHRAKTNRKRSVRESQSVPPSLTPVPTPRDKLVREHRRQALEGVLSHLPHEQAEAITLRFVVGLSLDEAAEVMGVAVNTVRSRVLRAKEAIRQRIDRNPEYLELLR